MTPTETTLSGKTYLMVEVPEGAKSVHLDPMLAPGRLLYKRIDESPTYEWYYEPLPPGNWTIIGLCQGIAESVWEGIVEPHSVCMQDGPKVEGWKDYQFDETEENPDVYDAYFYPFPTATASARSWIASHGMEWERCVLLEKVFSI